MARNDRSEWEPEWRISWRPMVSADVPAIHELIERVEDHDNPPYRTSKDEVRAWFAPGTAWHGRIGIAVGGTRDGSVICYSQVMTLQSDEPTCVCRSGVDPDYRHRGLGEHLVTWEVDEAKAILRRLTGHGKGRIIVNVDAGQYGMEEQLERHGFSRMRSAYEMRRELSQLPDPPELGRYQEVRVWDDMLDEQARKLFNRLRGRGQGDHLQSRERWLSQQEAFVPEWSFAAVDLVGDRPNVIGFVMVSAYRQDWDALGWREGYIDLIAADEVATNTGVSQALIIESMRAQRRDGMDRVATGIGDPVNDPVAKLYGTLDFGRSFETHAFALEV